MSQTVSVRVRFAPSPTGELHLGGARTALYEYLFAKHHQGEVFLRIEDTDQKRYVPGSMDRFIDDLAWLGIAFDGEPVVQSDHFDRHRQIADELVVRGAAYYEPVTETDHGRKRTEDEYREGRAVYRGTDRDRTAKPNEPHVVRLKVPTGSVVLNDAVRGPITFDLATVDDAVLLKSDGIPTYHLAAMVDDHDMEITHIIRSEEWLPSAPKHLLIFQAMEWAVPVFAHLPVILAQDGKKLSKRLHGESVWIRTYREAGYLPAALVNYLALLGWNPGGDQELLTVDELVDSFSLERVHKAGAKFDQIKLDAFQTEYVRRLDTETLIGQLQPFLVTPIPDDLLHRLVTVAQSRLGKLSDFPNLTHYFITLPDYPAEWLVFKKSDNESTVRGLESAINGLKALPPDAWLHQEDLASTLSIAVSASGLTNGDVFWPVRVALTGQEKSPSPAECLWVLGQQESLQRLIGAQEKLGAAA